MTYAEILSNFNLKLDKETNAYFNNLEIARLLNEALYRYIDDRYRAFESSNRISEQISPLVTRRGKTLNSMLTMVTIKNNTSGWAPLTSTNNDLDVEFNEWLYVLGVTLTVNQQDRNIAANATDVIETGSTKRNVYKIHCRKLDIGASYLSDPYLEGMAPGVGSHKLDQMKVYYQLFEDQIIFRTREVFGANNSEDFLSIVNADLGDTLMVELTCIRRPKEFTSALLASTNEFKELSETGTRDLLDYAIQIANEITRDTEGYQYISSQIQKDIL